MTPGRPPFKTQEEVLDLVRQWMESPVEGSSFELKIVKGITREMKQSSILSATRGGQPEFIDHATFEVQEKRTVNQFIIENKGG